MSAAVLINGEPGGELPAGDRGLAYGDGLFETMVFSGGNPRFWQAHMDRLAAGCERLKFTMPGQEILLREARQVASASQRCVVKILVTRGAGGRAYQPPAEPRPNRMVSSHPFPEGVEAMALQGVKARVLELRLGLQPALGGIKHLNRLEYVLGAMELAAGANSGVAQDGLLLDRDGHLVSALSANIFLVSGASLLTPRMDRCGVRGVMRAMILRDFKTRCELRRITPDMLQDADEVFLCNAVRGLIPVTQVDDLEWPVGPVTRELQAWFQAVAA